MKELGATAGTLPGPPEPREGAGAAPLDDTIRDEEATRTHLQRLGGAPPVYGWDRYDLLELLGKGGMGAVYKARDKRLDRMVAIKFLHNADPYTTMRFLQEARAQARIDHPNVCKVLEVGEVSGEAYIAMQLIEGTSLSQSFGGMTLTEKVQVMKTVAEAVHAAHRLGVIHRDIKPANIMVEEVAEADGKRSLRPVLMDFGLAHELGSGQGLTESGAVMGTPSYMPPEQARGDARRVDCRSDVYGIGATLYHLLAGEPPFVQDDTGNVLLKVLIQDPVPLREKAPGIPAALDVIVGKCLNKEPHQRYTTAADLADDLGRYLNRERVVARPLSLITRIYWRGKRNKSMAAAVVALCVSLAAFAGYGVRTAIVNARNEAIAKKRAELGQKLGRSVKDMEWLIRSAYLVPLHDVSPEKALVRERMKQIEAEVRGFGDLAAGLDHYALGRGHLALEEWDEAHRELSRAEEMGVHGDPELDYALGRVLGELYRRAVEDARKSGDKGYFEKRKAELDQEYLVPALAHLDRCRGLETVSADYLDGLIHFYNHRYDEALKSAELARKGLPWLYEAAKLEGDVFMARALDAKDHGDNDQAASHFKDAVARYAQAADVGRSDHEVYEALAEAWIRQEEMDLYAGRDPAPKLEKALSAAGSALEADPAESRAHTKKAFAYFFRAQYASDHGAPQGEVEMLYRAQVAEGEQAVALHPGDAFAQDIVGIGYTRLAEYLIDRGQPVEPLLDKAFSHLQEAIRQNPRFPWAYNDYGLALGWFGESTRREGKNPEEWYAKSIAAIRKATELDDQYAIAYNNTTVWLNELASWKAEHGEDPEKVALESVQAANRAIEINRRQSLPYGNAGLAFTIVAAYRLSAGQDGREPAAHAIERLKEFLAIDPSNVSSRRDLARAYRLLAEHERAQGKDPGQSLDEGLAALTECYRTEPGNADCKAAEAELRAEQAAWAQKQGRPFLDTLERAQRLASEVAQKLPDRADLQVVLGEILPPASRGAAREPEAACAAGPRRRRGPGRHRAGAGEGSGLSAGAGGAGGAPGAQGADSRPIRHRRRPRSVARGRACRRRSR